jgi:hypothetical protein
MARKAIYTVNNGLGELLVSFVADTIADIALLPTNVAVGSDATCIENKKKYILSTVKVWTQI